MAAVKLGHPFSKFLLDQEANQVCGTLMKCAFVDCINPKLSTLYPCTVCERQVHHLCSNDLFDPENIAVYFCSVQCVSSWKAHPGEKSVYDDPDAFEIVGPGQSRRRLASQDSESTIAESEDSGCSQSSVDLTSDSRVQVDAYGIPVKFHHYRQLRKRDDVWDIAHVLSSPYATGDDDDAECFTHVRVLCALRLTSRRNASEDAWEGALRKFNHTSNVKDHLVAKHSSHPIGKAEATKRVKRVRRQLEDAFSQVPGSMTTDMTSVDHSTKGSMKQGALKKLWGPSNMQLRAYIAKWLINDGKHITVTHWLPYNTVTSESFRSLMEVATGKPDVVVLSAQTFNDVLAASFLRFREVTKRLLEMEYTSVYKRPFLNLMHDMWAAVFNESHDSGVVQKKISSRIVVLYDVDIGCMAHFVMSDTAPAARKLSKLYEDAVPVDCLMHVLNLCLVSSGRCTPGGPFPEGANLVKKTRDLNNYFKTPQRVERLLRVQQHYGLPELSAMVDRDTRMASTVTLFQKSILNYPALKAYFQRYEAYDDPTVFARLSKENWQTIVQGEAVTHMLADLARIEVQREDQISSELLVLMRLACDRLNANQFRPYDVDALRTPRTTAKTLPRTIIDATSLCASAAICLGRIKAQVQKRLANVSAESIVVLFLDPRTKDFIDSVVQRSTDSPGTGDAGMTEEKGVIEEGWMLLRRSHSAVFQAMYAAAHEVHESAGEISPNLDLVPSMDDDDMQCGAPLTLEDAGRWSLSSLHQEADEVLDRWLSHNVSWVQVAVQQADDKGMTAEVMLVRRNGTVRWSLQGLFKHVDVCQWFKKVGAKHFPSVAALARVWLGRVSSNSFQERVFSTGGLIMSSRRTSTDNERDKMQVLLKQNSSAIKRVEPHGRSSVVSIDNVQVS
ncbi:hypothetical protein L917_03989 [Phytophthora nicotianae]|uniref:HAT C-terminal dimerisation domain-containing protein n=1 Tax=Phytophthora nicotianae TaxID=4792 RepID=W2LNQ9_PHYNI|nr:hypothetical protein L917_03989 [Phytophthora nicotianae]